MKKRIRYISILMIVCILGIIGVQGYWLYNAWDIAYVQFGRSINGALGEATGRKGFADMKSYLKKHPSYNPGGDSILRKMSEASAGGGNRVYFRNDRRQSPADRRGNFAVKVKAPPVGLAIISDSSDTLPESSNSSMGPSWYFIAERLRKEPYDLAALDSFFREELDDRGIHAQFVLDTAQVPRSDFHNEDFRRKWREHTKLQTHWIPVNPVDDIFVRASFQTPYGYLFGKLLWILIASLVLLALITWCMIYMLRTILKQKRWSDVKNDFISNMTHELKTPIATVGAAIEALQHFQGMEDTRKAQSYLDISQQELKRLTDLVEKVLQISIEENEVMILQPEKVNVKTLIDEIIVRQQIKVGKEVQFDFHQTLEDPFLYVDKLHFSNAVNNLIDNAIKYSLEKVVLHISIHSAANQMVFVFKDNGIGIPPYYQQLIFEKFFRVPTGDLHDVKGFGLGLSYVKKVVERHGGSIRVKSEAGKGAEFTIVMPRIPVQV